MKNLMHNKQRGERGQTLVEFALIAPVVLLILMAILSFGLAFSWKIMLNGAAREGARIGAVGSNTATVVSKVMANLSSLPNSNTVSVSIATTHTDGTTLGNNTDARETGGYITVTVSYNAQVVNIPGIISGNRSLVGRSTFRMEQTK